MAGVNIKLLNKQVFAFVNGQLVIHEDVALSFTLFPTQMLSDASAADDILKRIGIRRIASEKQISHFVFN